ncbi:hypothetical protein L1987_26457 [Smallanthus sonchifolius]|uniref:Uncharacterized protein n=1 Tax=Smallanthus sonchifolius TaxID=185202 RepID=A0ACB9I9Q1_9ASTR|nr:hypothetical protein L1987_26457 [Smallanthus sonchifolius]
MEDSEEEEDQMEDSMVKDTQIEKGQGEDRSGYDHTNKESDLRDSIQEEVQNTLVVRRCTRVELEEFESQEELVEVVNSGLNQEVACQNEMLAFAQRLKNMKEKIKLWRGKEKELEERKFKEFKTINNNLEEIAEHRRLTDDEKKSRVEARILLKDMENKKSRDLFQRAKTEWV